MKRLRSLLLGVIILSVLWGLMGCNATVPPVPVSTEVTTVAATAVPPTPTFEPTPIPTSTATATEIPTAEPIPGIEVPVEILGVDLLFISLEPNNSLTTITNGTERALIIEEGFVGYILTAESSNGTMDTIKNWPNRGNWLSFTLSNGEDYKDGVYLGNVNEAEVEGYARWMFGIPEGTTVKTVRFPDGTVIDLSLLLEN